MNLLIEHPTQAHGIQSEPLHLGPRIGVQMKLSRRMKVHMAIEATHTEARLGGFAVMSGIELLLRKLRDQHAQSVELRRRHQSAKQPVEVVDAQHFTL